MGGLSIWHWIIVIGVVLLLFGRGKISELMGDVAQGIKAFKKGMAEDDTAKATTEPSTRRGPSIIDRPSRACRRARRPNRRPRAATSEALTAARRFRATVCLGAPAKGLGALGV